MNPKNQKTLDQLGDEASKILGDIRKATKTLEENFWKSDASLEDKVMSMNQQSFMEQMADKFMNLAAGTGSIDQVTKFLNEYSGKFESNAFISNVVKDHRALLTSRKLLNIMAIDDKVRRKTAMSGALLDITVSNFRTVVNETKGKGK